MSFLSKDKQHYDGRGWCIGVKEMLTYLERRLVTCWCKGLDSEPLTTDGGYWKFLSIHLNGLSFQKFEKKYDVIGMVGIAVKIILKLSLGWLLLSLNGCRMREMFSDML